MIERCPSKAVGRVVCLAMVFAPAMAKAGEPVEIKPKFSSGRTCYVEMRTISNQTFEGSQLPNGKVSTGFTQTLGVVEKVESLTKDGAKIQMTFDRRAMSLDHPMYGSQQFDTDLPGVGNSDDLKRILSPSIGMSMNMQVDGKIHISSFTGMDAILKKVRKSASGAPLLAQLAGNLNNEAAKETWGNSRLMLFPNRKVNIGDTWKLHRTHDQPQLGTLINDITCKLDRVSEVNGKKMANISYTGTITMDTSEQKKTAMAMAPILKGGTIHGTATFDIAAGQIIKQAQETTMQLNVGRQKDPNAPPIMRINMTSTDTTFVKTLSQREKEKKEHLKSAQAQIAKQKEASKPDKPKK